MIRDSVPFDTGKSGSAVQVEGILIRAVGINKYKVAPEETLQFKEAINILTPGDIFTLKNSVSHKQNIRIEDGLYLVTGKEDDRNKGLRLTRLDADPKDFGPIKSINKLIDEYKVSGDVKIAGSLNVIA